LNKQDKNMNNKIGTYLIGLGTVLLTATQVSADPFLSSVTAGAQSPATIAAGASVTYLISITTNVTDASGPFSFADLNVVNYSSRFYRAALPH
jgi:hypothetical protein